MGGEWKEMTLGELVKKGKGTIQTGPFGSQLHASDYVEDGIPCIMPMNMLDGRVSLDGIARISRHDAERLSRHIVKAGDIVYSRRGDVTRNALIGENEEGMFCGTGCLLIRPGTCVDARFLSYHLSSPLNKDWIIQHAIGATMPNLNTGILSEIPLKIPPLPEQKAIAELLGSLDDKIELNRKQNATLEAMAQALFQSWFVDFDPVIDKAMAAGHKIPEPLAAKARRRAALGTRRKPLPEAIAALFPDRFVETQEMGWVPEGWEMKSFGSLLESAIGGDWGKDVADDDHTEEVMVIRGTDIPDLKIGGIGKTPVRWVSRKKLVSRQLMEGDIVIEISGGSPTSPTGRSLYVTQNILERLGGLAVPASFCRLFRPTSKEIGLVASMHLTFIYDIGKTWQYQNQSTGISNFQTSTFLNTECVPIPKEERILSTFFEQISPLFSRATNNEAQTLSTLRDTLLPKLISGELRLQAAEATLSSHLP